MLKNDKWIKEQAIEGMIYPFESSLIRRVKDNPVISYGTGSYGYDIRLSPIEFLVFNHKFSGVVNPKDFLSESLEAALLETDEFGSYFVLPAHSYGLGVALEYLSIPNDITVICVGKSTYARCGIILNCTPGESGWKGHLTLELSNSSACDCRIYADEGIAQLLFFEGEPCEISYSDRDGKYQDQQHQVVLARA